MEGLRERWNGGPDDVLPPPSPFLLFSSTVTSLDDTSGDDEKGMMTSVSSLKDLIKQQTETGIDPSRIVVGEFLLSIPPIRCSPFIWNP